MLKTINNNKSIQILKVVFAILISKADAGFGQNEKI